MNLTTRLDRLEASTAPPERAEDLEAARSRVAARLDGIRERLSSGEPLPAVNVAEVRDAMRALGYLRGAA